MALRGDNKVITEQWEKIKELFEAALECAPRERTAFLANLRREHPSLAGQVSGLLASYEKAGDFLQQPLVFSSDFLDDLEEPQRFSPNEVLCDRFKIIRLVGKGGMGEVYEALDQELDERVALKTLRYEVSSNEVFTARFRREIQLARKVTHPNVCRIFESFRHQAGDGTVSVLSMELLQGVTLDEYLKSKGRLGTEEALPLARQIIEGLSAVHAAGIIHRDLKPSNLVLVPEGEGFRVRITDFGIAGRLPENPSQPALTQASKMLGTPDYMAPEQLERGRANIQSDIYALGLVLYEMVTGARPFTDAGAWKRLYEEPRPPRKLVSDLPEHWNKTILCCLERNPAYRFADAAAVAKGLSGDAPAQAIPRKPLQDRLPKHLSAHARIISIGVISVLALLFGILRFLHLRAQNPNVREGSMLLLTSIVNQSHDSVLGSVTDVLRSQLSQSAYMNLLDEAKIRETLSRMSKSPADIADSNTARELAMRNGVPLVVFGTVSSSNDGYRLDLDLERVSNEPERPRATWKFSENATTKKQFFQVIDDGSVWIRRMVGETEADLEQRDRRPEDVTTDSWEALQLYSQGQQMAAQDRLNEAVLLFKEATDKDPNFAMAWMRAGDVLDTLGNSRDGLKCWKRALESSGVRRLSQREELRIKGMYASDTGDLRSAVEYFAQYSLAFPNDYLGFLNRSYSLMMLGKPEQAIPVLRDAERLNRESYYVADHLARQNLTIGSFRECERYTARLRTLGHPGFAEQIEGQASFLKGDYQRARELFAGLHRSDETYLRTVSYYLEAALFSERGQYNEAISSLSRGASADLSTGDASDRADKLLAISYLYLKSGKRVPSRDAALQSLKAESGLRRMAVAGSLLARGQWISDARRILHKIPADQSTVISSVARLQLQGEILLAEGRTGNALSILEKASELDQEKALLRDSLARALMLSGRTEEALREFTELLRYPGQIWQQPEVYPPGYGADLLFQYAKLAAQLHAPGARTKLSEYLKLRAGADPGLPDVQSARAILRAFTPTNNQLGKE